VIIVPDEGKIPWWRLLWSLLGALLIGVLGAIALMTDMNDPGPIHVAIELVALPLVRPAYYLLGLRSDTWILVAAAASVILWWCVILLFLLRKMRRGNQVTPA
jgi:hypothetical protein